MKYKCPKCGGEVIVDRSMVLTSYPPKYKAVCTKCGEISYPFCSEVTERFPEDLDSFLEKASENLKLKQEPDLTPNTTTITTPQSTETTTPKQPQGAAVVPPISYGWVCPICGKVHAPWVKECDCKGAPPKANTEGPLPGLDYPHFYGARPCWYYDPYQDATTAKDPPYWLNQPTCMASVATTIAPKDGFNSNNITGVK